MKTKLLTLFLFTALVFGCSSNSLDESLLLRGQLTQGESQSYSKSLKHGAKEPIEDVKICALGKCSVTDMDGEWGFTVNYRTLPATVSFSINGHGIDTASNVSLPMNMVKESSDIFIHFEHNQGKVKLHHMEIDGQRMPKHGGGNHHK